MFKMEKKGKKLSGVEKEAKMSVISGMRNMASDMMKDSLKGIKASPNKDYGKDLKRGEKSTEDVLKEKDGKVGASDLIKAMEGDEMEYQGSENSDAEESDSHESDESPEHESDEDEKLSEDELNKKLEKLMKLKERMKK